MQCKNAPNGDRICSHRGRTFRLRASKSNKAAKAARMRALRRKLSCKQNKSTGLWVCKPKRK